MANYPIDTQDILQDLVFEAKSLKINDNQQWWQSHKEIEWKYPFATDCSLIAGRTFNSLGYTFASCYQVCKNYSSSMIIRLWTH